MTTTLCAISNGIPPPPPYLNREKIILCIHICLSKLDLWSATVLQTVITRDPNLYKITYLTREVLIDNGPQH